MPSPNLLSTDPDSIVLDLVTPNFELIPSSDDYGDCLQVQVPGYAMSDSVGEARLPIRGTLVGVPDQGVEALQVLETAVATTTIRDRICVVSDPPPDHLELDLEGLMPLAPETARESQAKPVTENPGTRYAELVLTGKVREQTVAVVRFRPFHYDAHSGVLSYASKIVVKLDLVTSDSSSGALEGITVDMKTTTGSYGRILNNQMINAETALPWSPPSENVTDLTEDLETSSASVTSPAYRVTIEASGLYQIAYADLQSAAPSVDLTAVDADTIKMMTQDQEIAIRITGDDDGQLDPGDTILFYGEAINSEYSPYNAYWLTWDSLEGLRMAQMDGTPSGSTPTPLCFSDTLHIEENHWYMSALPSDQDDRWYWDYLNPAITTRSYTFAAHRAETQPMSPTVSGLLTGYGADPNHSIEVYLNGHQIHTAQWNPAQVYHFTVDVPAAWLLDNSNVISMTAGIGVALDVLFVNWFEVSYCRNFAMDSGILSFSENRPDIQEYIVTELQSSSVELLDTTVPTRPVQITNSRVVGNSGPYTLTFQHEATNARDYFLAESSSLLNPIEVELDQASNLRSGLNTADYILIAPSEFITAVQPLADLRTNQGLRVSVVDVQDIYDEFSAGNVSPESIRAFLRYAYENWLRPAPAYVVLVGDGNYDPLDHKGYGEASYIPPYLADVDPWMGETAADNLYVCVSGDDPLPDMHLGRLPVKSIVEAESMVDKVITYDTAALAADWNSKLLFVADNPDSAGDFYAYSDSIADHYVPQPYTYDKLYYGDTHTTVADARKAITETINSGVLAVNYVGHAASGQWAQEGLLKREYLAGLQNEGALPFMSPMTCLEGYFIAPSSDTLDYSALSESIVRLPTTGAIASWSPTGWGLASGHDYLNRAIFDAIFKEDIIELGPATTYAKLYLYANSGGYYQDLLDTYTLFGDPATRLNVLPVDAQIEQKMVAPTGSYEPGDPITYMLTYTNTGPAAAHHVVISNTISPQVMSPTITTSGMVATLRTDTAFVWDIADLPAGTGGMITVTGTISETTEGILTSTALIETTSKDSETSNNQVTITRFRYRTYLPLVMKTGAP